ncbi:hypothetical protein D3C81_1877800 [compost metagenome]
MFHREQCAGTARAALDFIGNQHDPMLVTNGAQALHKGRGGGIETAFALDRFNDDGGNVFRCGIVFEDAVDTGDGIVFADVMQRTRIQGTINMARHQPHTGRVRVYLSG